ncbi:uncharacterized protein RCC_07608 [Ramularia collo-cygni]|uniref:Uncharacterized protein n=1 Tax=Ramularia collo-cygni TaxID=112498 RepID=A0A2D3VKU9_9PEZI|nr:uncharacterized protein RCC_07608 [Ramularia collo-cygni]CZT21743.1 uncharacterized protein RCC_07608 [Ramularia collo-cygni]
MPSNTVPTMDEIHSKPFAPRTVSRPSDDETKLARKMTALLASHLQPRVIKAREVQLKDASEGNDPAAKHSQSNFATDGGGDQWGEVNGNFALVDFPTNKSTLGCDVFSGAVDTMLKGAKGCG